MAQDEKQSGRFQITPYLPIITFWLTVFVFGLGLWLEFKSPGIALIGASIMSWLGHFTDWVAHVYTIKYQGGAKE